MGKGYNNFMSKKAFHPASCKNQKRVHEAEAKAEAKRKHEEETLAQYMKEQELFNQKSLVSKQSKEKLSLNFMYEAPPGFEKPKDEQNEDKVEFRNQAGASSTTSGNDIINRPSSSSNKLPGICLEWKRERPVKRTPESVKQAEVKKEPTVAAIAAATTTTTNIKREIKQEPSIKVEKKEQQIDLKWKRNSDRTTSDTLDTLTKRVKKER